MKSSSSHSAFYAHADAEAAATADAEHFESTPATAGPWSPAAQHGGPPAALLGRAMERLEPGMQRTLGSFTMDLLGPVPVGPVSVAAEVARPGRSVSLRTATLYDQNSGRAVARASAWALPRMTGPAGDGGPPPHDWTQGRQQPRPPSWSPGYLDAVEWSWIDGAVTAPGPAKVWMRPRVPLLAGEELSPVQRLLLCGDSASGVSAALDPAEWNFLNTELTVHVHRPPSGEWLLLEARTFLGGGAVGTATSVVFDPHGPVAHTAQALLVVRR